MKLSSRRARSMAYEICKISREENGVGKNLVKTWMSKLGNGSGRETIGFKRQALDRLSMLTKIHRGWFTPGSCPPFLPSSVIFACETQLFETLVWNCTHFTAPHRNISCPSIPRFLRRVFPFVSSTAFERVIRWNGCVLWKTGFPSIWNRYRTIIGQPSSHRGPIENRRRFPRAEI